MDFSGFSRAHSAATKLRMLEAQLEEAKRLKGYLQSTLEHCGGHGDVVKVFSSTRRYYHKGVDSAERKEAIVAAEAPDAVPARASSPLVAGVTAMRAPPRNPAVRVARQSPALLGKGWAKAKGGSNSAAAAGRVGQIKRGSCGKSSTPSPMCTDRSGAALKHNSGSSTNSSVPNASLVNQVKSETLSKPLSKKALAAKARREAAEAAGSDEDTTDRKLSAQGHVSNAKTKGSKGKGSKSAASSTPSKSGTPSAATAVRVELGGGLPDWTRDGGKSLAIKQKALNGDPSAKALLLNPDMDLSGHEDMATYTSVPHGEDGLVDASLTFGAAAGDSCYEGPIGVVDGRRLAMPADGCLDFADHHPSMIMREEGKMDDISKMGEISMAGEHEQGSGHMVSMDDVLGGGGDGIFDAPLLPESQALFAEEHDGPSLLDQDMTQLPLDHLDFDSMQDQNQHPQPLRVANLTAGHHGLDEDPGTPMSSSLSAEREAAQQSVVGQKRPLEDSIHDDGVPIKIAAVGDGAVPALMV